MQIRTPGRSLQVSSVGLDCMDFSHTYGAPTDAQAAVTLLRQAYDLGYTFLTRLRCTVPRRTRIAASGWQGRLWPLNSMERSEVFGETKRTVQ